MIAPPEPPERDYIGWPEFWALVIIITVMVVRGLYLWLKQ